MAPPFELAIAMPSWPHLLARLPLVRPIGCTHAFGQPFLPLTSHPYSYALGQIAGLRLIDCVRLALTCGWWQWPTAGQRPLSQGYRHAPPVHFNTAAKTSFSRSSFAHRPAAPHTLNIYHLHNGMPFEATTSRAVCPSASSRRLAFSQGSAEASDDGQCLLLVTANETCASDMSKCSPRIGDCAPRLPPSPPPQLTFTANIATTTAAEVEAPRRPSQSNARLLPLCTHIRLVRSKVWRGLRLQ